VAAAAAAAPRAAGKLEAHVVAYVT
jgi:hypothetical protein